MCANSANVGLPKTETADTFPARKISRRNFVKQAALLIGFAVTGCSPVRILLKAYPEKFDQDKQLVEKTLRAFVLTVVPGASLDDPNLIRIYSDDYYPFCRYCGFFVFDLAKRSAKLYGDERFDQFVLAQRTAVIETGLRADASVARLYRAAVFMAQVSFYGGIYEDEKGCPLIDFHGTQSAFGDEKMFYPQCTALLAREITRDGNYG